MGFSSVNRFFGPMKFLNFPQISRFLTVFIRSEILWMRVILIRPTIFQWRLLTIWHKKSSLWRLFCAMLTSL